MSLSITHAAQQAPARPALITPTARLSYAELADRALVAVSWLRRQGRYWRATS
jgi:non-ribosomal peptide synthetase component E (peptide arylation enzyme)